MTPKDRVYRHDAPGENEVAAAATDIEPYLAPYDENLLERARNQWQFGDWQSLSQIDIGALQHHPDRAKLALLAASGHLQTGELSLGKKCLRLAQDWGLGRGLITRILAAGVHNSLARASVLSGQEQRALIHFETSVAVGSPGGDRHLLAMARIGHQISQFKLPGGLGKRLEGLSLAADQGTAVNISASRERLPVIGVFTRMFDRCRPYMNQHLLGDLDRVREHGIRKILDGAGGQPENIVAELMTIQGSRLALDAPLRFLQNYDIPILLREILIDEVYRFNTVEDTPLIIDGGANFGLATYYFKKHFPKARIIAFEPNPDLADVMQENIHANNWRNVEFLPYALSGASGVATLNVPRAMPMGGSISNRLIDRRKDMMQYDVVCQTLGQYLDEKVAYLKLDIEGPEVEVLEQSETKLGNVARIFCEFHFGDDLSPDRLPRLLSLLERTGFRYTLGAGHWDVSGKQPFNYLEAAKFGKSLNVHALRPDAK
ncbi:MAG: FkbM family methyltransferase [Rhodocyclaceae bacterium]|nr:FkbM family methyltransferase [Rhodocyclaceae bacterium]